MDNVVGTAGNDVINASQTTLNSGDAINGGAGNDTLLYIDSSAAGVTPASGVTYTSVENINVRNINGSTTPAVAEVTQIAFNALAANATVIVNGRTITAGGAGATATEVAQAYATGAVVGGATPTGAFTVAQNVSLSNIAPNLVTLTATTAGTQTDFTATGTAPGAAAIVVTQQGAAAGATGSALTISAAQFTGATQFNSDASTGDVNYTGLVAGQSIGKIGGAGALSGAYGATVTSGTVNVSGASTGGTITVTGAALATLAVNSTGSAANTIGGLTATGVTTVNIAAAANLTTGLVDTAANGVINVSGAATSVTLGTLDGDVRTVNASGLTAGGLTATLSNAAQNVTGGVGNDIISTGATALGLLTGLVDAGAGTGDRLVVQTTADVDSAAKVARYVNFEQLQVNDGASANLDLFTGITAVRVNDLSGATGFTNLSAAQAGAVTVVAANPTGGAITLDVKGAATAGQIDTVTASLVNTSATNTAVNLDLSGIVLTGVENLNLNATGTVAANSGSITLTTAAALQLQNITLTGAAGTNSITIDGGQTANNLNVNASGSSGATTLNAGAYNVATGATLVTGAGADSVTGSGFNDVITTGAGNDTIVANAGADTVNAGEGNDTIQGNAGADNLTGGAGADTFRYLGGDLQNAAANGVDRITDFVAGTDKISLATGMDNFLNGLNVANNAIVNFNSAQTIATAADVAGIFAGITAVAASAGPQLEAKIVTVTGGAAAGTYLYINDNTAGVAVAEDFLVNITGITGTLSTTDFAFA